MNKVIEVCLANQLTSEAPVEAVTLMINQPLPRSDSYTTLKETKEFYQGQAEKIIKALHSLPQGTLHWLLIYLLQERREYLSGTGIYQHPDESRWENL